MTTQHRRWETLHVLQPDQVPASIPFSWIAEKESRHSDLVFNSQMPADFPYEIERGTAEDALAVLALREAMYRQIEFGRGNRVHEAVQMGATWEQVGTALDMRPEEARQLLRRHAEGQRNLWLKYEAEGVKPIGFSADQYAAALELCDRVDAAES